jgi:5-methylcytosine-specific restriction endonuclease McrA
MSNRVLHIIGGPPDKNIMQKVSDKEIKKFYSSNEWKTLREEKYKEFFHFCRVCGSEENLVVDHVKPVRYHWDERLNEDNLQILCSDCNLEKSSIVNWTLEYHLKNKKKLEEQRIYQQTQQQQFKTQQQRFRDYFGLTYYEIDNLVHIYEIYARKSKSRDISPATIGEFRKYMESLHKGKCWSSKKYVIGNMMDNFDVISSNLQNFSKKSHQALDKSAEV